MNCTIIEQDGWTVDLRLRAMRERIPLSGMLELTQRCNLRCRHCYLGESAQCHHGGDGARELNARQWAARFQEWTAAGCLNLLITGGEPLIRPDFPEIYRYAVEAGMLVTVFTNGTRVTPAIAQSFHDLPPRNVEISLYGATARTFDNVTRTPGAYEQAWRGIRCLLDANVRLGLKSILMTLNQHELVAMAEQAAGLGLPFRYDPLICPPLHAARKPRNNDLDGERTGDGASCADSETSAILALRTPPEQVAAVKQSMAPFRPPAATLSETERNPSAHAFARKPEPKRPHGGNLYSCAAGATLFFADPFGAYAPCLMTVNDKVSGDGSRTFQEIWENELVSIRHRKRKRSVAGFDTGQSGHADCPAMNLLETGDPEIASSYVRSLRNG